MRIALCDDETVFLEYLKNVIDKFGLKLKESMNIELYQSAEEMLFEIGETIAYDLIFLDIQMGKINGMELAKKIRKIDENVCIVFLTGVSDYVYDGYKVGALRYLLKPVKEEVLYDILKDVKSKFISNNIDYLIIEVNRETIKINIDNIIYIEAMGHYVTIYTMNKTYDVKYGINDIEKQLNSNLFIRIHRSYIVNIKQVEKINKENCVLSNKNLVSISRGNYNKLNEAFINYYRSIEND